MKRHEQEKYGFGPSLATKQQRLARAGFIIGVLIGCALFMVAKWT